MTNWNLTETYTFEDRYLKFGVKGHGPPVIVVHGTPWGSPFFRHVQTHEAAFAGAPDYIHEAIVCAYIKTAAVMQIPDETMDNTVQPWTGMDGKASFYRQIAQAKVKYTDEVQSVYSQISKPLMILWGTDDSWIPIQRGRLLHELIPGSLFF
ncbi:MAG: hypothetical protein AB2536_00710 [Candidatus Thiodiazotropha endolucinida]